MDEYIVNIEYLFESKDMPKIFHGKNWVIEFFDKRKRIPGVGYRYGSYSMTGKRSKHMVVKVNGEDKFFEVLQLFHSALMLIEGGESLLWDIDQYEYIKNGKVDNYFSCMNVGSVLKACDVARKASFNRKRTYALHRLARSYKTVSIPFMSLDPTHSENFEVPTLRDGQTPYQNVLFAEALFLAWSSIEELGLKPEKRDVLNVNGYRAYQQDMRWLTKSKEDLELRMLSLGIESDNEIMWCRRGRNRSIDGYLKNISIRKTDYCRGFHCRDYWVKYIDAVLVAFKMRNDIAAHEYVPKNNPDNKRKYKLFRTLSIYEVHNIQHLARDLLLSVFKVNVRE